MPCWKSPAPLSAPTLTALYAFGDDRIRQYRPAQPGSGSNPGTPAGLRYYHADGLGSTRLLTDEAGATTDHYAYEAFGELDAAASLQASDNDFLYTGEQLDPNSEFYYLRARYMNLANGRFTQMDAWAGRQAEPDTMHKYAYTRNAPSNKVDPSGNFDIGGVLTIAAVGGAIVTAGVYGADYYSKKIYDNRVVYLDFSGMEVGSYPVREVIASIIETVEGAYSRFGITFTTTPGLTKRSVSFDNSRFGLFEEPLGHTLFMFSRVFTGDVIDQCEKVMIPQSGRRLTGKDVGTALGNVAAHEIGHGFGAPHIDRADLPGIDQLQTIMDSYYVPNAPVPLPWAESSIAYLRDRLK